MYFKPIKIPNSNLTNKIIAFCLKSKPYSFCETSSRSAALFKTKEYIDFLFDNCEVYLSEQDGKINLFIAVSRHEKSLIIDFIFGDGPKTMDYLREFREFFVKENPEITGFFTQITRKHKLQALLSFVRRYDKTAQINIDNSGKIEVYWEA